MTNADRRFLRAIGKITKVLLIALAIEIAVPFVGGVWYSTCGERFIEQRWLDNVISHLRVLRSRCNDPELQGILDYTVNRYNKVGGFDVMVAPCFSPETEYKYIGLNQPFCPGISIDTEVLFYPIHEGAMVLVHEALHDYWPCWGHSYVTPTMKRIEAIR